MPPRPAGGGGPPTQDDTNELLLQMAQSSQQLSVAVAAIATSQASFMRSAADVDANIGLSKSHSLLLVEQIAACEIDNTMDDYHRSGLPAALRDLRPSQPSDYVSDRRDSDYDPLDTRHGTDWGAGHDDATTERADALTAYHRTRGRNIRTSELSRNSCLRTAI